MFLIAITNGKNKKWLPFATAEKRNDEYTRLREMYRHQGCGGMCDCFRVGNNHFYSCMSGLHEKVENLKMAS